MYQRLQLLLSLACLLNSLYWADNSSSRIYLPKSIC